MPSIKTASEPVTEFPYKFVSPFSLNSVDVLYSSINFVNPKETTCIPCVVCENVSQQIAEQASRYINYNSSSVPKVVVGEIQT